MSCEQVESPPNEKKKRKRRGKTAFDEKLLIALACGATVANAAREAGLCEKTVLRRMSDPDFAVRLRQLRGEMLERAGGALVAAAMKSVQTLLSLQDPGQPAASRLGAARAVLDLGLKIREIVDLEVRLKELEQEVQRRREEDARDGYA